MVQQEKIVSAFVFNSRGLCLLLLKAKKAYWGFPGGHIEPGESELDALRRELKEETGIENFTLLENYKEILTYTYTQSKANVHTIATMYALNSDDSVVLSPEHSEFVWVTPEKALHLIKFEDSRNAFKRALALFTTTFYDEIADGYEDLHKDEQIKKARIIAEHLRLQKHQKLLDVGTGTGFYLDLFSCEVMGIDPSEGLLKKNKFPHKKGSAEELPFEDNAFDAVISITSIHNFSHIEQGLQEIKRVGKHFAFSILKASKQFDIIDELIHKLFSVKSIILEDKDVIYFCEK
jgi:bis(5'-nucleosidyl)-tetraphosphatase